MDVGAAGSSLDVSRPAGPVHNERVAAMVRTLIGTGFFVDTVMRKPAYLDFVCHRYDEFGIRQPYVFVLTEGSLSEGDVPTIQRHAERRRAQVVVVGPGAPPPLVHLTWDRFVARVGGEVRSWLPLEPEYPAWLGDLGHNRAVAPLPGRPDDVFEELVHVGLTFILANRVIRYGQERRFEILPDGAGFAGRDGTFFLYDAKAYADGYKVEQASIRQFSDYVDRFHERYESHVGRIRSFLVISGHFADGREARRSRSDELYDACGVKLSFMTAEALGKIVACLKDHPTYRNALPWRILLSRLDVTAEAVQEALATASRDGLVRE
jgi:hypothetical protein